MTFATGPGVAHMERREQRLLAESVPCPYCHAAIGEPCVNRASGEVLRRLPAHLPRLQAADVPL